MHKTYTHYFHFQVFYFLLQNNLSSRSYYCSGSLFDCTLYIISQYEGLSRSSYSIVSVSKLVLSTNPNHFSALFTDQLTYHCFHFNFPSLGNFTYEQCKICFFQELATFCSLKYLSLKYLKNWTHFCIVRQFYSMQ